MLNTKQLRFYAAVLLLLLTASVASLSYFSLQKIKQTTLSQTKNTLQTLLNTAQESHHILVEQRRITIESIAEKPKVIELTQQLLVDYQNRVPLTQSEALKKIRALINPVVASFGDDGFFVIAPDRISIASMRNVNLGSQNLINIKHKALLDKSFAGESVFIPPIKSDVLLTSHNSDIKHTSTMFVIAPIRDQENVIISVLAFRINPMSYFSKVTSLSRIGESGETYAFDNKGMLLTESRFTQQIEDISLFNTQTGQTFEIYLKDPGGDLLNGFKPIISHENMPLTYMAQQAIQGLSGTNTDGYRDYRGIRVFGAWLWDKKYNFGIAAEVNAEEALQSYYHTRDTFIIVLSITLLLSMLLLVILHRVKKLNEIKILQVNEALEMRVTERTIDLQQAKERLSRLNVELDILAKTDGLTQLYNRRYFDDCYTKEWQRCTRDKKSLAIIMFDIDYFKQYNDFYGHQAGDACLKDIGHFLTQANLTKRPSDIVARYGGEEFIMLLTNPSRAYCNAAAREICDGIKALNIGHEKTKLNTALITVSVGYVHAEELEDMKQQDLLSKADQALYCAKRSGRNNVFEYQDLKGDNITSFFKVKNN